MVLDFLAALLALILLGGVGSKILALSGLEAKRRLSPLEKTVFSTALGALPASAAILAMGLLSLYAPTPFLALALLLAAFSGKHSLEFAGALFAHLRACVEFAKQGSSKPFSISFLSTLAIMLLLALHFLYALSPPASHASGPIDWDSLGYHLAVPKLYALQGGISFLDFQPNSNWPFALQMLYVPGFALGFDGYAKLLQFGLSLALLGAMVLLSRKVLGSSNESAVVSTAILLSSQVISFSFGSGAVDLALALYSCCTLLALLDWRENGGNKWLALSALFAGGVAATKLNGFVALPVFVLAFAFAAVASEKRVDRQWLAAVLPAAKKIVLFSLIAFLVVSPWMAKTAYFTGNPVWPFYHSSFGLLGFADNGSAGWTQSFSARSIGGLGVQKNLENFLALPFHLTFSGRQFNGLLTPLFLALLPLLLFAWRPRQLRFLLGLSALYLAAWFFSFQEARYLFPVLPIWAVAAAHSLVSLKQSFEENHSSYKSLALKGVFALVLLATIAVTFAYKANALPVALGLEAQESYLLRSQYNFAASSWINGNTPAGAKVLLVNDNHAYYLDREFVNDAHWFVIRRVDRMSGQQFLDFLRASGVTHVMINSANSFEDHPHAAQVEGLVLGLLSRSQKLFESNGVQIYVI